MSSLKSTPSSAPTAKNAPASDAVEEEVHDDSLLSEEPLDTEHKLSQSEMKESDIKHLSEVLQGQVTEEQAKTIFDRYIKYFRVLVALMFLWFWLVCLFVAQIQHSK